jgi:3-methyladenine DNA glycosylase AlkD
MFVAAVRRDLAKAAQPERAAGMRAYLKSEMPCYGVSMPLLRQIVRSRTTEYPMASMADWRRATLRLWRQARFREERHAAIEFVRLRAFKPYRVMAAVPMVEEMIVTGAWWDLVDSLAGDVLGDILAAEPAAMPALMRRWSRDADKWKRRSAILCQLKFKAKTDSKLLYDCIEPNLADKEFFIRKAIGWALRQYAWTNPPEVKRYVRINRTRLSPLSLREATKHI